jgi:hypothetical protein
MIVYVPVTISSYIYRCFAFITKLGEPLKSPIGINNVYTVFNSGFLSIIHLWFKIWLNHVIYPEMTGISVKMGSMSPTCKPTRKYHSYVMKWQQQESML